jgi:hypothetical protein
MIYLKCRWKHSIPDEPTLLYSELDDERWERRKVEIFADGRARYADRHQESGDTRLGLVPVPTLADIAADPQFDPAEVSKEEFELVWNDAVSRSGTTLPHANKH